MVLFIKNLGFVAQATPPACALSKAACRRGRLRYKIRLNLASQPQKILRAVFSIGL